MASIVENIVGDRAIQLGNEEFVRKMTIGNNWNYLRIGMRVVVNGASNITAPRFQIGLNNGDQNTFSSSNCAGYLGIFPYYVTTGWTYSAGPPPYYNIGAGGLNPRFYTCKKLVNTTTDGTTSGTGTAVLPAVGGNGPSLIFMDVRRASASSYDVYYGYMASNALLVATNFYALLRAAEDEPLTSTFSQTYVTGLSVSATLTGLPSNFDTVSIYWNKSTPTIEISDICAVRFY